jgi:hypothetical protein
MAQIIRLKRSTSAGSKPTTGSLETGELAVNVYDGRVFTRKSGSVDEIIDLVTLNHEGTLTGSLNISGSITATSFVGDGSQLTNISIGQTATVQKSFTNQSTWVVDHNLNTVNAIVQVYDNDNYQIIPQTLRITDNNNVTITFESARSGYVVVANGGHIVSGSVEWGSLINKPSGLISGSSQITLNGDVTGTADATVISQIDGGSI